MPSSTDTCAAAHGVRGALALGGVLALGLALRLFVAVKAFYASFDTSTVGLMAMHILEGERPLFYYGQNYMGALEAYVAALMFFVFGVSSTALALSPILFALGWILATYLLFGHLFGRSGGLAAALCTAAAGWYALWYTLASHGGYPATFCLGTLFLWLAVRLASRPRTGRSRWLHAMGLGVIAALGVWTNLQVLSFLATGCLVLAVWALRGPGRRARLLPLAACAGVGVLGLIPFLLVRNECSFGTHTAAGPSLASVRASAAMTLEVLPRLFTWPRSPRPLAVSAYLAALAAALGYGCSLVKDVRHGRGLERGLPLLFLAVFFTLYLPHPLASLKAPRYLIAPSMMALCAAFAGSVSGSGKRWRALGWAALAVWVVFNTEAAVETARLKSEKKAAIERKFEHAVNTALEAGHRHVVLLGSAIDGLEGQSLTFAARDRVRFVSSFYERYDPAAQAADVDPDNAFLFGHNHLAKVKRSIEAVGIRSYRIQTGEYCLLDRIEIPRVRTRSVPPASMQVQVSGCVQGRPGALVDRCQDTLVGAGPDDGRQGPAVLLVDMHRQVAVAGLWLTADTSARLPKTFRVERSVAGSTWRPLWASTRNLHGYVCGNKLYLMGYAVRIELRCRPATARYLRITLPEPGETWDINELAVFEYRGRGTPVSEQEVQRIVNTLQEHDVDFTVADRYLSARLRARWGDEHDRPVAFPRLNPRYAYTVLDRDFRPRRGLAVAVPVALGNETEALLHRSVAGNAELVRLDFPHYAVFVFHGPGGGPGRTGPSLTWHGHLLMTRERAVSDGLRSRAGDEAE